MFVATLLAAPAAWALPAHGSGERLVTAARAQIGTTTSYDPRYTGIAYPNGDVPRSTGVCADVVVRAYRDAFALDLQKLVHEDMAAHFAAYPRFPGASHPDPSIDHRRVLNLQAFFSREHARLWSTQAAVAGDAFPGPVQPGDLVTWLLGGRLPHIAVIANGGPNATVVHNIGRGAEELPLTVFHDEHARGHYRWLPV